MGLLRQHDGVTVQDITGKGRGLRTTVAIPAGTVIIEEEALVSVQARLQAHTRTHTNTLTRVLNTRVLYHTGIRGRACLVCSLRCTSGQCNCKQLEPAAHR